MQSTTVYWMPVLEMLEREGLEVYLVNAQHTKNVPGRKSDIQECQWLLKLHAFGLLRNSFQPTDEIRIARTLWRQRGNLVAAAASAIQRMQKALIEMNVQLSGVLSDISGVSGMKIVGASPDGERDPWTLAAFGEPGSAKRNSQKPGGELARGIVVRVEPGSGAVPNLSEQDRRLRPAATEASGVVWEQG